MVTANTRILSTLTSRPSYRDKYCQLIIKVLARMPSGAGHYCLQYKHLLTLQACALGERVWPHKTSDGDVEKGWWQQKIGQVKYFVGIGKPQKSVSLR